MKASPSDAGGGGSICGWGAKIPRASQPINQNIKQKQCCDKFSKNLRKEVILIKKKKKTCDFPNTCPKPLPSAIPLFIGKCLSLDRE